MHIPGERSSSQERDPARNALLARIAEAVSGRSLDEFGGRLLAFLSEELGADVALLLHQDRADAAATIVSSSPRDSEPAEHNFAVDRAKLEPGRATPSTRPPGDGAQVNDLAISIETADSEAWVIVLSRREEWSADDAMTLELIAKVASGSLASLLNQRAAEAQEIARREADGRGRLEAVLEAAPVGIAVISADGLRFEIANQCWLKFARQTSNLTLDAPLVGVTVAAVLPELETVLKEVAESGASRVDEEVAVHAPDGMRFYTRTVSVVPGRLPGTTQNLTVLVQDVTEEVRARRELAALAQIMEERSARLDSILGSMTDALWVYDINGRVIDVNESALTIFGFNSRSDAVRHGDFNALSLRHRDGRPLTLDEMPLRRALRGEVVPDFPAVATHLVTRAEIDISIAAAPVQSRSIVGAVLVIRDITALQELDRKKDEFLSVASHELRTPLTTIRGYAQLLLQLAEDCDSADRSAYLTASIGEIDRMMGLVSDLLDVSRIETNRVILQRQEIDWVEFLRKQIEDMRVQHGSRMIELHIATSDARVSGDPGRLRQVVDNLVTNGLKYSPEQYPVAIRVEKQGDWIETSVTDRGIGIPADEIDSLFDRFHRASNVSSRYYGGLGLGLYIVKAIVVAHGGAVVVSSEEGHGSTFTVRLPAKEAGETQQRR